MTAPTGIDSTETDAPKPDGIPAPRRFKDRIPLPLLDRLAELRPYLLDQLCLLPRGRDANGPWRLRVRVDDLDVGRRRISVEVGDKEAARAVTELVCTWREEAERDKAEQCDPEEERRQESLRRYEQTVQETRRHILDTWGGGSSRRRRIRREFDEAAAAGPPALLAYLWSGTFTLPSPRPGQRSKSGLC